MEDIREGIAKIASNNPNPKEVDYETADIVLAYLHSQGVVRRVECKHDWMLDPITIDTNPPIHHRQCRLCREVQSDISDEWEMMLAGYVAVEPLIEK